jgi:integrase
MCTLKIWLGKKINGLGGLKRYLEDTHHPFTPTTNCDKLSEPDTPTLETSRKLLFGHLMDVSAYQNVPIERHPVAAYLARLSANSRPTMQTALAAAAYELTGDASCADQLPWHHLRFEDVQCLRMLLAPCYAPATTNRVLAAVRGVLRACQVLGYISAEQQMRLNSIPPVLKSGGFNADVDITIREAEVKTLLHACHQDPRPAGRRDAALLALLYGVGLHSSEAVNLDLADYSPRARSLTIRQGNEKVKRQAVVSTGIAKVLHHWLLTRGEEPGPFFVPISKSGRPQSRRLRGYPKIKSNKSDSYTC